MESTSETKIMGLGLIAGLMLIALLLPVGASARPGNLEPEFGDNGLVTTPVTGTEDQSPSEIVATDDGATLVVGDDAGTGRSLLRKFLADGTLDPDFGDDGTVSTPGSGWDSVAETGDGKIIVAGSDGNLARIARFDSNGMVDASFGVSGSHSANVEPLKLPYNAEDPTAIEIFALEVLDDGRIRAIGSSYLGCQGGCTALMEIGLLADGSPDPDFGDGSGIVGLPDFGEVTWALIEPDGRAHVVRGSIVEGPEYSNDLDITKTSIDASGQAEPGGESGSWLHGAGYVNGATNRAITFDGDGHLLIGVGYLVFDITDEANERLIPGALNRPGRWDVTRFLPWRNAGIEINDLETDANGRLLISGGLNPGCCDGADKSGFIARFLPNGRPDATFGGDGIAYAWLGAPKTGRDHPPSSTTLTQSGDSIVIAGKGRREGRTGFNLAKFDAGSAKWPRCDGKRADYIGDNGPDLIENERGTFVTFGGDDRITGASFSSICSGAGNDVIAGRFGSMRAFAGPGNDRIDGSRSGDLLKGGSGKDVIDGRGRGDTLAGGPGNDRLFGGAWNDRLFGGPGRDVLKGGASRDQLFGGPARDRLRPGKPGPLISIYRGTSSGITNTFIRVGRRPLKIKSSGKLMCSDEEKHRSVIGNNGIKVNQHTGRFKRVGSSSSFVSNYKGRFSARGVTGMFAIVDDFEYSSYTPCWTGKSVKNPWVPFRAKLDPRPKQFAKQ